MIQQSSMTSNRSQLNSLSSKSTGTSVVKKDRTKHVFVKTWNEKRNGRTVAKSNCDIFS